MNKEFIKAEFLLESYKRIQFDKLTKKEKRKLIDLEISILTNEHNYNVLNMTREQKTILYNRAEALFNSTF